MLHVTGVSYITGFRLRMSFDDGTEGEIDLFQHLKGPVFIPLKDESLFKKVRLDPEISTIVWPNGADFAPEFLHKNLEHLT